MALKLYNSLAKGEEIFPLDDARGDKKREVTMYTCGPTVYGRPHIGNYSAFLMADLLRRWLEAGHGCTVKHVKNITDVGHLVADAESGEDKIEKEARRIAEEKRGKGAEVGHDDVIAVAEMYTSQYLEDEALLRMMEPYARPKASEYVEQMKGMIETLLENGHAYVTTDGIYFDVTSKLRTPYGSLSGNKLDDLQSGARVDVNEEKKHPADFALWKFCVGTNEHHVLRWPSPKNINNVIPSYVEGFPDGFPGWHIECSAMSRDLLGDTIDIHTGGEDNIFPHHECEIAQSESVTGMQFVRFWLHKRRIDLGKEKMSKSLGNVVTIPDIIRKGWAPMDLRFYFLSVHYRTNMKFTDEGLNEARDMRRSIADWIARGGFPEFVTKGMSSNPDAEDIKKMQQEFSDAMDSDLNVSVALATVHKCMTYVNTHAMPTGDVEDALKDFTKIVQHTFGCFDHEEENIPAEVQTLVDERALARKEKNFAKSDTLRDAIAVLGYEVKDTSDGQKVRKS